MVNIKEMKKFKHIIILFSLAIIAAGCEKLNLANVDFDVSTIHTQYHVGDTVTFDFKGNPDNLAFYTGEAGFKYINKDRVIGIGVPQLSFTTYRRNANTGTQENTLFLYASTDFSGKVDSANVVAATWVDITDRATFSTGLDFTPSGIVSLEDFVSEKPVYLAFKYVGYAGSIQRVWNVKNFDVVNILPGEPASVLTNLNNAGWTSLNLSGSIQWTISAGNVYFFGPASPATYIIPNEDWLISKPLYLNKVFPDKAIPLKNISTKLSTYNYIYKTSGTYDLTFVASNANVNGEKSVVKSLKIEVLP